MTGERGLPLVIFKGDGVETIRFYSSKFLCWSVHWLDKRTDNHFERSKIERVECDGWNCRLCLAGNAPSLRFSGVVKHDGEQKEIDIPRNAYLRILELIEELGRDAFRKTDLHVWREQVGGGFREFRFEVAS